ncbi:polyphosphate:AMP phosphotransferase [Pseudomonas sp. gcc21]|uniref:polyphosphate:AMP phosphotransferase n=1 Tax=Pseudomonas sp. gcc21 TaxID=2726989 RepID=UPI00145140C2|nr:polyphosphate:AMP phosphotransferase [Pseudomonas sp. gcc21]QJD59046.1 polyphosphate:AMP phosphotransferase [Pseudomonas sp. gcc21]
MTEYTIDKKSFKEQNAALTEALLEAQYALRKSGRGPVLVLISGNDFAGKAEAIYAFYERLDNRFLDTRAFSLPEGLERRMPRLWRYWRSLPPAGQIGFYLGSWYHQPLMLLSSGKLTEEQFARDMEEIVRFEQLLINEGVAIIKLWLHLTPDEPNRAPPAPELFEETVAMREWGDFSAADYERVRAGAELMSQLTSTAEAPWIRVRSYDPNYRDIFIGQIVLKAMQQAPKGDTPVEYHPSTTQHLRQLDYSAKLEKPVYRDELEQQQARLRQLVQHPGFARHALLLVFEGTDAAGKGGTIRRITQCLDPRRFRVFGTSAPTDEERSRPYLWRFWRRLPAPGSITIFDRSYYGRVLVERVEGFAEPEAWQRAYAEINDFEQQLQDANIIVIKFWLAITAEEQLKRFEARDQSPLKRYKLTDEDWRNRKQWPAYEQAVNDMVEQTSTDYAPWHLIPSEDKRYARIAVLKTLCETLETKLC